MLLHLLGIITNDTAFMEGTISDQQHRGMDAFYMCIIFLLSLKSGCGIQKMVYLSRNVSCNDASSHSTCQLLDLTGDTDIIGNDIFGSNQSAWIGAYSKRVWINFDGCYYENFNNDNSGIHLTMPGDPAKYCLRHCNFTRFVLTEEKCVCYNDVSSKSTTGCIAGKCYDTIYTYCGMGTTLDRTNTTNQCMCHFSLETQMNYQSGTGA